MPWSTMILVLFCCILNMVMRLMNLFLHMTMPSTVTMLSYLRSLRVWLITPTTLSIASPIYRMLLNCCIRSFSLERQFSRLRINLWILETMPRPISISLSSCCIWLSMLFLVSMETQVRK